MMTKKEIQGRWLEKNPWYPSFNCAKSRCKDKSCGSYEDYGGKGIKFLMDIKDFKTLWHRDKAHLMKKPSIDRLNSKKHYIITNCRFIECEFINCNLSDLNWGYSSLEEVSFVDCKLTSIQWAQVNWPQLALTAPLSFKDCQLSHSSFYELALKGLTMVDCFAKDVDFRHANLAASDFSG
ncbi:hypothetical protein LCGC14_2773650, partial [marine sediment metagenome]